MDRLAGFLNMKIDELGMSQADVARASGLSTAVVAQIFSGKTKDPRLSTALIICDTLGIDVDELARALR